MKHHPLHSAKTKCAAQTTKRPYFKSPFSWQSKLTFQTKWWSCSWPLLKWWAYSMQVKTNEAPKTYYAYTTCPFAILMLWIPSLPQSRVWQQENYRGSTTTRIINHSALIYRIINLKSINAELFERFFDKLEDITKKIWSWQPDDLIPNTFLHVQAEDAVRDEVSAMDQQDKEISRLAKNLPVPTNTIIGANIIKKESRFWQAHIQRNSRLPKNWWDWREDGSVEFYDGKEAEENKACGPLVQHFRSTSIKAIQQQLHDTWQELYQSTPHLLPVQKLGDVEGKITYERQQNPEGINSYKVFCLESCQLKLLSSHTRSGYWSTRWW